MSTTAPTLVLASRSAIRGKLLADAGIAFVTDAADVDEEALGRAVLDPAGRALRLATEKAQAVSARRPGAWVLGVDQVGVLEDGSFLEKPRDAVDQARMLCAMSGRAHTFFVACALAQDREVRATVAEAAPVHFAPFDAATASAYAATGEGRWSCGGYESENRGAQLIAKVDGSLQVVLGLPLFSVLAALRQLAPGLLLGRATP